MSSERVSRCLAFIHWNNQLGNVGAFDYKFGALDGHANELGEILKHMLYVFLSTLRIIWSFHLIISQRRFTSIPWNMDYTLPSIQKIPSYSAGKFSVSISNQGRNEIQEIFNFVKNYRQVCV